MIKRPFVGLSRPKLKYDAIAKEPESLETIPLPDEFYLHLGEPIDSSKIRTIMEADEVKKGELLSLYTSSSEYAVSPVSGTIQSIDSYASEFGSIKTSLTIAHDKNSTQTEEVASYFEKGDFDSAYPLLKNLPGTLPCDALRDREKAVSTIVITGTDSDLMSLTNQYVLTAFPEEFKEGVNILKRLTGISKVILTVPPHLDIQSDIQGNDSVEIITVSDSYPDALPHLVLKNNLGITVPAGKRYEDLGIAFISAEAVLSIAKAFTTKAMPLEKIVFVTGKDGMKKGVKATIGTPIKAIIDHLKIEVTEKDRVIIGGPMTGFATYSLNHPVDTDMNTIIVQDSNEIPHVSDCYCINCGKCIKACPAKIPVNILVRYLEAGIYETAAEKFDLDACIECGLCSYVCTARIPLFQYIKLGKLEISKLKAQEA